MIRTQLELFVGLMATIVLLIFIPLIGVQQGGKMEAWSKLNQAQEIEKGAQIFEENCRDCHGANGEGVGEQGPPLNDAAFFSERLDEVDWQGTLEDYIYATTEKGRIVSTRPLYTGDGTTVMVMVPWGREYGGSLRPNEIRATTKYVMNWKATAMGEFEPQIPEEIPSVPAGSSEDQIQAGKQVFVAAGCANCHILPRLSPAEAEEAGPDLSQVASAAGERIPEYGAEDYLRESILIPNAYRIEGYPQKTNCGGVLSESQLEDLVAFLLSLK